MHFPQLAIFLLLAPLLAMISCESPIPRHGSFDHYYGEYMEMIKPDIEALDQDLADGLIDQRSYDTQVAALTDNVGEKVNNLLYFNHQMRENDWQTKGLPTAGQTPRISTGGRQGGRGGAASGITSGGRAGSFGGSQGAFGGFGGAGTKGMGNRGAFDGLGQRGGQGFGGGGIPGFGGSGGGGFGGGGIPGTSNPGSSIGRVY